MEKIEIEIVGLVTESDAEVAEMERSVEDEYQRLLAAEGGGGITEDVEEEFKRLMVDD